MFMISCTSDKIWNLTDLIGFLVDNQNSDIKLDITPEAICLTNLGLYDLLDKFTFTNVTIHTWNPFEQHSRYNIKVKGANFWFKRIAEISTELQTWNLSRRFLCFYHRPTAARLGLAAHLWNKHNDTSLIHFSATDAVDFELDKLLQWNVNAAADAGKMLQHLPLLQGSPAGYTKFAGYHYTDNLTNLYRDILIDVVVESHVAGQTFFPTEKTIRPILLKKPFIIFGSRDYLAYFRQMGFRTFGDFWNEEYDGYEAADRYIRICDLLDDLSRKSIDELEKMYWDMQYTLDYNYNLLVTQQYNNTLEKL